MAEANWQALRAHFNTALTLEGEALDGFLRGIEASDPPTAAELRRLLTANSTAGSSLTGAVSDAAASLHAAEREALIGTRVGSWVVESHLARGGMGDVYLGRRADGAFEQRVAVKFIGSGMLGAAAERFAFEQRVLARLNHPNIARILDVGATPEGQSFLVMEYVDGVPIDEYCRAQRLSLDGRIELFARVCDAVAFAHSNLVVHRDVKPANVLVEAGGRVKLLDFGISKLLEEQEGAASPGERTLHAMTPDFASPEQMLGGSITTRSDVYSLGVLLYLLVTGRRPYSTHGLRPSQVEKLVCEDPVASPSRRARAAGLDALARELRGDLDRIVLKAMAKDPDARYAGVQQLVEDVRRHLRGFPVEAQGRSWFYIAGKFVQRHALGVAAASAVLIAAVVFGVYHGAALTRERDLAAAEAARAQAVSRFLKEVFSASDPDVAQGNAPTAKQLLDAGAARIDADLDSTPALRATLSTTIADAYESLGLYDEALALYRKSLQLHEDNAGTTAEIANDLRNVGATLYELDDTAESLKIAARVLELQRGAHPGDHQAVAIALNDYAHALYAEGEYTTAIQSYREALEMQQRLPDGDPAHLADMQHDLAQSLMMNGDLDAAEPLARAAVRGALVVYGEKHSTVSTLRQTLASVLQQRGATAEARELLERVVANDEAMQPDHPDRADTLIALGTVQAQTGQYQQAEDTLRKALAHARRTRGNVHEGTAYAELQLANLLTTRGRYAEARPLYAESLATYRKVVGPDNPYLASVLLGYAGLDNLTGAPAQALIREREARRIIDSQLPAGHWIAASADSVKGESLMLQGRLAAAGPLLEAAYPALAAAKPGNRATLAALRRLVDYYRRTGDRGSEQRFADLLAAQTPTENP